MPLDEPKAPLNDSTKAFGDRVRERRTQLGISQEVAADRISIHWSALGKIERGQRSLRLETILKVAAGLDMDAGDLLSGLPVPKSNGDQAD